MEIQQILPPLLTDRYYADHPPQENVISSTPYYYALDLLYISSALTPHYNLQKQYYS